MFAVYTRSSEPLRTWRLSTLLARRRLFAATSTRSGWSCTNCLPANRQLRAVTEDAAALDPDVAALIARCLERDPARRPASAIQVSAALPGGDPLYLALAAGETPSPEMVAAAGTLAGMRLVAAVVCIVAVVAGLLVGASSSRAFALDRVSFDLQPEVLANKARELLRQLGDGDRPQGTAYGFAYHESSLERSPGFGTPATPVHTPAPLDAPIVLFWYRESATPLVTRFDEQLGSSRRAFLAGGPPRLARVDMANSSVF